MVQTWSKARRGGNDVLDGGAGSDMAVFFGAVQHMGIKLRASTAVDAAPGQQEVVLRHNLSAEEDILRGVEWLQVGGRRTGWSCRVWLRAMRTRRWRGMWCRPTLRS